MKMQILFVLPSVSAGGTARVATIAANWFVERGYEVSFLITANSLKVSSYKLDARVKVNCLDTSYLAYPFFVKNLCFLWFLIRSLYSLRPLHIFSFLYPQNIFVILANSVTRSNLYVSERSSVETRFSKALPRSLCTWLYPFAKHVIVQSNEAMEVMNRHGIKNVLLFRNPIYLPLKATPNRPNRDQNLEVLCVGRLAEIKNHKSLILAMHQLNLPNVHLTIVGGGELKDSLQKLIDSLGLADTITLAGHLSDLSHHYKNSNIFILPSFYEGLSNALLEAMSYSLPCIVTPKSTGGLVFHERNGIITDSPSSTALKDALLRLVSSSSLRRSLSSSAFESVQSFDVNIVMRDWVSLISK